jgi:hypothetical protein
MKCPKALHFYCYPVRNSLWSAHLWYLEPYRHLFDFVHVTISVDDNTYSCSEVEKQILDALDADSCRCVDNDDRLGQSRYFLEDTESILRRVGGDKVWIFYNHAKGISYAINRTGTMHSTLFYAHRICWFRRLYKSLLPWRDEWDKYKLIVHSRYHKIGYDGRPAYLATASFYWHFVDTGDFANLASCYNKILHEYGFFAIENWPCYYYEDNVLDLGVPIPDYYSCPENEI